MASYNPNPYSADPSGALAAAPPSNGVGMIGMILSIVGIVTCGVLSPLALLVSLVGLTKTPRTTAIVGTVISLIGCVLISGLVYSFFLAARAVGEGADWFAKQIHTETALSIAAVEIEEYRAEHNALPDGVEGNKLIIEQQDAWNNTLRYEPGENNDYSIRSAGPDGVFDTPDDVVRNSHEVFQEPDAEMQIELPDGAGGFGVGPDDPFARPGPADSDDP